MSPLDHARELTFKELCPSKMPCSPVMGEITSAAGAADKWSYIKRLVNRAQRVTGTENDCSDQPEKVAAFAFLYGVNSIPREVQAIVDQAAIPKFLEPDPDQFFPISRSRGNLTVTRNRSSARIARRAEGATPNLHSRHPRCNELIVRGYDTVCLV